MFQLLLLLHLQFLRRLRLVLLLFLLLLQYLLESLCACSYSCCVLSRCTSCDSISWRRAWSPTVPLSASICAYSASVLALLFCVPLSAHSACYRCVCSSRVSSFFNLLRLLAPPCALRGVART